MFEKTLFALCLLLGITLGMVPSATQSFRANFVHNDPNQVNFIGTLTGRIDYSYTPSGGANTQIRRDFNVQAGFPATPGALAGPIEIILYESDDRYLYCTPVCERTLFTQSPPLYHNDGSGSSMGSMTGVDGRSCDIFSVSNSIVATVAVDTNNVPCRITQLDGQIIDFLNPTTFSQAAVNEYQTFQNCPQPTCNSFVDVVFVGDESGSINSSEFDLEIDFAIDLTNSFTFGLSQGIPITQAGIAFFNSNSRTILAITPTQQSVINAFNGIQQRGGGTCIPCGGNEAFDLFAALSASRRALATAIMIVFTDGANNNNAGGTFNTISQVGVEAVNRGIIILSVAVGLGNCAQCQTDLETLSADPASIGVSQTVFNVNDFNGLSGIVPTIVGLSCIPLGGGDNCIACNGFCSCGLDCRCPDVCDDNDVCTIDDCDPMQNGAGCTFDPVDCDDNNACTTEFCQSAGDVGCVYTPVICDDMDVCTMDSCDPMAGCVYTPIVCDDMDVCTMDSCVSPTTGCVYDPIDSGFCVCRDVICPPSPPCGENICNNNNGLCEFIPTVCNDGNACTSDACNPTTNMCEYTPIVCDDGDECTTNGCAAATGCFYTPFPMDACVDDSLCTNDFCDPGTPGGCVNEPIVCDDGDVCTTDTCLSLLGCQYNIRDCGTEPAIMALLMATNNNPNAPCFTSDCDSSLTNGCRLTRIPNSTVDQCGVCNGDGTSCGDGLNSDDIAGIGAGVIAALVIALVACLVLICLAGGKTGYDVYLSGKGGLEGASTSPLYNDNGMTGTNAMYQE